MPPEVSNNRDPSGASERPDAVLAALAGRNPGSGEGREAASELLGRYRTLVYRWCFRYVRNHEQALDLAQEVLLCAYRRLGAFEGRSCFSSWLFAIARNRCLSAVRRPPLLQDEESDPDRMADPRPGADETLEAQSEEEEILRLMRRHLSLVEQKAFYLRCFERLPVEDITRLLEIEGATGARGVLQSARRKLRGVVAGRLRRKEGDRHG
jgi:RNA polymerase sigma-70 factor (ECF subfamily)